MKTKKVLALLVLSAMLISIMPVIAFGAITIEQSWVVAPEGTQAASAEPAGTDDGQEFRVMFVGDGFDASTVFYVASSRPASDQFFYKHGDYWDPIDVVPSAAPATNVGKIGGGGDWDFTKMTTKVSDSAYELRLKVVSSTAGTSRIAFASTILDAKKAANNDSPTWANVIDGQRYSITFSAANAWKILLNDPGSGKVANGVDTYTFTATVLNKAGIPISGQTVNFTITSGVGGVMSATSVTTNSSGKAEMKLSSTRQGAITVQARTSVDANALIPSAGGDPKNDRDEKTVTFGSTGIVSIKADAKDDQKVARVPGGTVKKFRVIAYDANLNRINFVSDQDLINQFKLDKGDDKLITGKVVTSPSGSSLVDDDIKYAYHSGSGNFDITVPYSKLNRDGAYEIKVYLMNGSTVSYKFTVKNQGEVTTLILDYGANSYSSGTKLPEPKVKTQDAEGYEREYDYRDYPNTKALSISRADFLDGQIDSLTGSFKLKDDKDGLLVMTLIDRVLNLVAIQEITIAKPASYLKLTPRSSGAVNSEVVVDIELVDIDGQLAAVGLDVTAGGGGSATATVIGKPEGAIASTSTVDTGDFKKGKSSVRVVCDKEGQVNIRVIVTEDFGDLSLPADHKDQWGGRTYTGATTVNFGAVADAGGTLIFIIGAPSFVTGSTPHAAQSPAFIEGGRTYLGVRDIGTAIGATIDWDPDTNTATLAKDNVVVKVTVGATAITVTKSGVTTEVAIDAAALNKDGRVYLPFRAVLEAFGYNVEWEEATQSIICTI